MTVVAESKDVEAAEQHEQTRLIGEVNHATGNLVQRMLYWTAVLEEGARSADASAAVDQLKESLGELHSLVNRTMDLVRPVDGERIQVGVVDLVEAFGLRFGAGGDRVWAGNPSLRSDCSNAYVEVDPIQLDKALGMLAEATAPKTIQGDTSWVFEVSTPKPGRFQIQASRPFVMLEAESAPSSVGREVTLALAEKLLSAGGWELETTENEEEISLVTSFNFLCQGPGTQG